MKRTLMLLFLAPGALAVALALPPPGHAQQVGDNFTVIVPIDAMKDSKKVLVVTGKPQSAISVGTCFAGQVRFQSAELVDRDGKAAPIAIEVAVVYPGASGIAELKPGWRIGSWRAGGKCGPGYEAFVAHLVSMN